MHPILEETYERLQELHTEMVEAIEGLPTEALDWVPGPEMNSLCVLAVHVAGAEGYLIGEMAGQEAPRRDRPAEFRAKGLDGATLVKRLDEALARNSAVLERLTLADLEATRVLPGSGREVTVFWCLAHALEHTGLHLGQMQITRQLWQQRGQR